MSWQELRERGWRWSDGRPLSLFENSINETSIKLRGRLWARAERLAEVPSHILIEFKNVSGPYEVRLDIASYPNRWFKPEPTIITRDGIYPIEWPIQEADAQRLCLRRNLFLRVQLEVTSKSFRPDRDTSFPEIIARPAFEADWEQRWQAHTTRVCAHLNVVPAKVDFRNVRPARAVAAKPLGVRVSIWGSKELKATGTELARRALVQGQINASAILPIITRTSEATGRISHTAVPIDALTASASVAILTHVKLKEFGLSDSSHLDSQMDDSLRRESQLSHLPQRNSRTQSDEKRVRVCLKAQSFESAHPFPFGIDLNTFRVDDDLARAALFDGPGSSFGKAEESVLDLSHSTIEPWALSVIDRRGNDGLTLKQETCIDINLPNSKMLTKRETRSDPEMLTETESLTSLSIGWPLVRGLEEGVLLLTQEVSLPRERDGFEVDRLKMEVAPVEGCLMNCNNRGKCESFVTASDSVIHLCDCLYGWSGRSCDVSTEPRAGMHNALLIASNLMVLVPTIAGIRYLHHRRFSSAKWSRSNGGRTMLIILSLFLFCNVGLWSALYHTCGQTGFCFDPTTFKIRTNVIDPKLISSDVTSEMFLTDKGDHLHPLQTTHVSEFLTTSLSRMVELKCLSNSELSTTSCTFSATSDVGSEEARRSIRIFGGSEGGEVARGYPFVGTQFYPTRMVWARLQRLDFFFAYFSIIFMCIFVGRFGLRLNLSLSVISLLLLWSSMRGPTVHEAKTVTRFLLICASILSLGAFNHVRRRKPQKPWWSLVCAVSSGLLGLLCWFQSWRYGETPAYCFWHSFWHVFILLCPAFILIRQDEQLSESLQIANALEIDDGLETDAKTVHMLEADERTTSAYSRGEEN